MIQLQNCRISAKQQSLTHPLSRDVSSRLAIRIRVSLVECHRCSMRLVLFNIQCLKQCLMDHYFSFCHLCCLFSDLRILFNPLDSSIFFFILIIHLGVGQVKDKTDGHDILESRVKHSQAVTLNLFNIKVHSAEEFD